MIKLCSSFLKADKSGPEIDQACNSCCIPGFCASIVLAFISGVELFDYVVDGRGGGGGLREPGWGRKPNGGYGLKMGESNPQDVVGVTQLCRISRGESLFSLEFLRIKWQIYKFKSLQPCTYDLTDGPGSRGSDKL